MQNRKIQRFIYRLRHDYLTLNNIVLAVAAIIAISWAWASVQAVQRNYQLQREVDDKRRQLALTELETQTLEFEQRYYKSREYQALEAKRRLGLAEPGEKVVILPPNTEKAKTLEQNSATVAIALPSDGPPPPPFQQWVNFLFGGNRSGLDNK
jgi:cell division protein FtsB